MKREFYSCENCEKKFVGHYNLKTHVCQKEPSVIEETNVSLQEDNIEDELQKDLY